MDTDSHCYEMVAGAGLEPILMPRKQFIKEHKNLLNVLQSGDPAALKKEAADQKAELEKELSGGATHRENVFKKYKVPEKSYSLKELAKISRVPESILQDVYNRGIGAYKTQPQSVRLKGSFVKNVEAPMSAKLSKEQWAMARVYSFLDGNPKHDNDLRGGGEEDDHFGLVGGRGQASGFIMRMMAENKKKHQGDYRNPSAPDDYNSSMKTWVPFDYKKLANDGQGGENEKAYGASPFIQRHFAGEPTRFVPKALRSNFEAPREGETEEQRAARLQSKAEELVAKAQELLEGERKKKTVKGFLQGQVAIKRAKKVLEEKKQLKTTATTGEPTAASTRAEADLYIAAHSIDRPEPYFRFLPQKGAAAAKGDALYYCRIEDGFDSAIQDNVLKPFISAANQIKVKPGLNANTLEKRTQHNYQNPYHPTITYHAPKREIEVYYKGQRIPDEAITDITVQDVRDTNGYYVYKLGYNDKDINLVLKFDTSKHSVDTNCRRYTRERYGFGGGYEEDPSRLSVSLKELKEKLYIPYYIGHYAADAFRREELKKVAKYPGIHQPYTEKDRKEDIAAIKRMLKQEGQPPIYRVLWNGKEYIAGREKTEEEMEAEVAKEQAAKAKKEAEGARVRWTVLPADPAFTPRKPYMLGYIERPGIENIPVAEGSASGKKSFIRLRRDDKVEVPAEETERQFKTFGKPGWKLITATGTVEWKPEAAAPPPPPPPPPPAAKPATKPKGMDVRAFFGAPKAAAPAAPEKRKHTVNPDLRRFPGITSKQMVEFRTRVGSPRSQNTFGELTNMGNYFGIENFPDKFDTAEKLEPFVKKWEAAKAKAPGVNPKAWATRQGV
jgi:hypothetical protein